MSKILQLEAHVADLIAAGEVVERPASVIKELMENAIDAGSTMITVEIRGGGMTYMRVTDNGSGIAAEDAETAFLRHATSKLRDEKGLEAITTLGFRGEALAAIAAVSRIELLTRETGAGAGTSLLLEGGVVKAAAPAGCPEGTTMIVRDLFFNTPARLKFMKTDRAESAGVSAQVISTALSHPEVSVRYLKDGKEECHTPGDGRRESAIYSLFGREFAGGLLKAASGDGGVSVAGFVSAPANARGNRSYQYFFVNGRPVRSKTLQAGLEQAYRNALFTGRYPSCILYITTSPGAVDVNVHPTKTEVKFQNEHQVFDGVYYAALSALEGAGQPAELRLSESTKTLLGGDAARNTGSAGGRFERPSGPGAAMGPKTGQPIKETTYRETTFFAPIRDGTAAPYRVYSGNTAQTAQDSRPVRETDELPESSGHRVVGEALGTYIIAEQGGSLWLIDKHAAHERIHFDRLKNEKQVTMSQTLLDPMICDMGREDTALLIESAGQLEKLGLAVEPFGEASLAVREIPQDVNAADIESLLGELAQILRRGGSPDDGTVLDALRQSVACKAAIKAGSRSEPLELETLARRVFSGEIKTCPHGRPVAIELTKAALDRNFKRT